MHPHGRLPTPNSRHNHCNRRPTRSRNTSPRTAPAARRRHIRRCNRPARTRARAPRENEKGRDRRHLQSRARSAAAPPLASPLRAAPLAGVCLAGPLRPALVIVGRLRWAAAPARRRPRTAHPVLAAPLRRLARLGPRALAARRRGTDALGLVCHFVLGFRQHLPRARTGSTDEATDPWEPRASQSRIDRIVPTDSPDSVPCSSLTPRNEPLRRYAAQRKSSPYCNFSSQPQVVFIRRARSPVLFGDLAPQPLGTRRAAPLRPSP